MNKKWFVSKWVWLIIGLVILVAGAVIGKKVSQPKTELIPMQKRDITEAIYALGKVKSTVHFEVKIGILTTLRSLEVQEGESVKKGQRLLQFEDSHVFSAPIDGVVTKINYYPGEIVTPQTSVLRIDNLERKYIEVVLEQQGALRVKPGQKARIDFESIRSNPLSGKVATLFSRDDEFIAQVEVENLPPSVLPGMTSDVVIEIGSKPQVQVVPVSSVQEGRITVLRDGKKIKVPLQIGAVDGEWAEVLSGDLKETDKVIMRKKVVGEP